MGRTPLPPLPALPRHLLPVGHSIPVSLGCRGEAASAGEGIDACPPLLSPASPGTGLEQLSLAPRPLFQVAAPRQGSLPLLPLLPLGCGGVSRSPALRTPSPWRRGDADGREGRGFSGLSSRPRGGDAAPWCPAVPAGLSSSQSRGEARIHCGLAAAAGLGFR